MPGAYARFERMLPMPALTRDDASGNALAHLPTNIEVADLPEGPVLQSGFVRQILISLSAPLSHIAFSRNHP